MYRKSLLAMAGLVVVTLTLRGCGNATLPTAGRGLPDLVGAKALSNHYVEVTFTETAGEDAEEPGAYSITNVDGAVLPIDAARRSDDGTRVILTTGLQEEIEYQLSLRGKGDVVPSQADPAEVNRITTTFFGSLAAEPYLSSAISLGPTRVLLTFSEQMDGMVNVTPFYRIAAPDLHIVAASQAEGMPWVVLTTDTQENVEYTVKATNVASLANGTLIDPTRCTASFYGIPPEDDVHPTLTGATSTSATSVLLSFSEPLDDGAADPNNFSIDREVVITEAELKAYNTQVMLTTLPLTAGTEPYEAAVSNANGKVRDMQHNALDPDPSTATFTFTGQPGMGDASTLPRVVGAISTDNTHVVVIFSKPMEEGTDDPSHYTIVQVNVNPEVGTLRIEDAPFVGPDRTSVTLTTSSQSEVTYQVTVVNVRDQVGNPLGVKSMFADPTSAAFAGTPPSGDLIDTDGDGLSDSEELRGWVVMVVLAGGETTMREVTSDPTLPDTDNDGLDDAQEKRRVSDPRDPDTDDDLLDDHLEVTRLFSSPTHQDTDGDGIDDFEEVDVYQTSPILADTDGDGFDDRREIFELNRNPRIADLPQLQITVGDLALRIDERFIDQITQATVSESSSSTTLSRSEQTQFSRSDTDSHQMFFEAGGSLQTQFLKGVNVTVSAKGGHSWGDTSQTTTQSAQESQQVYQNSLSKAEQFAQSVTREVVGASIDSYLVVENVGDVAFTLSELEISAMLPGRTRDRFVPIATMLPAGELVTGDEAVYNLAPFEQKGPIIISSREIYPNLVEDLMRNPRGLIFEVANYNITDEFGRNMAFQKEEVLGRTVSVTIDPGDGTFQRYAVATNGAYGGRCAEDSGNPGTICRDDRDCCTDEDGSDCPVGLCEPVFFGGFDEHGTAIPLPLDFVMRDILGLQKNPNEPNAIVAGVNGRADTVAEDDDIQLVPIGTKGLNDRTIVVLAGADGVLDTEPSNVCNGPVECPPNSIECCDDVEAFTTGYETSPTCNADTAASINEPKADGDGIAGTTADGDDVQEVAPHATVSPGQIIVSAGRDGILETVVAGDDEYRGPGEPCYGNNADCPGGACDAREVLVRFENSKTGDPNRFWVVMTSEEICKDPPEECSVGIPAGSNFGDIPLRPTQAITLAFGQDIDRDGLFAREEFIYGSKDNMKDSDEDTLGDFAEIREGWVVKVAGQFPEQVYPDPRFADSDFDGLEDPVEQDCLTDPTKRDTDGDGLSDAVELGITTDFNGNGEIDDFERGFGRCCEEGQESDCPSEPTMPCRTDDDCADEIGSPVCLPYVHRVGRCCKDATGIECVSNPTLACDASRTLVQNGEFEENAEGWLIGDGDTFWLRRQGGAGWNGEAGYFSLNDVSGNNGIHTWISQDITGLATGETYIVSGYYRSGSWSDGPSFQVEIDDVVHFQGGYSLVEQWTPFTFDFVAAEVQVNLEIRGEVGSNTNYDVDGICVDTMCRGDYPYPVFTLDADLSGVCPPPDNPPDPPLRLDPRNPDTDGDTIEDAEELALGLNPLDPYDADAYRDADQDGLYDWEEMAGWVVTVDQCDQPDCTPAVTTVWCDSHPYCVHGPNLVQNGEFDDRVYPNDPEDPWQLIDVNTTYGAWSSQPGWDGRPGLFLLNAGPEPEPSVWQIVDGLEEGETYVVSGFYKSGTRWNGGPSFQVLVDDELRWEGGYKPVDDWTQFGFVYVASRSEVKLHIKGEVVVDGSGNQSDYYIDGIRVETECLCFPDPLEGDTDFDGLPDFLERELGTNPGDDDTDGDGILDYDEFAEFGAYMSLAYEYPGFYLSDANSRQVGTDPTSQDTDGDRLPDFFELTEGWRVLACTDSAPRNVMSDPLYYDTDLDGLSDVEEYLGANGIPPADDGVDYDATDPSDPDTDGDGYLDKDEAFPLGCGKKVTVIFHTYYVGDDTCDPAGNAADLTFKFEVLHNNELIGSLNLDRASCPDWCATWCYGDQWCELQERAVQPIDWLVGPFEMRPSDQLYLGGTIREWDSNDPQTSPHNWIITPRLREFDTVKNEIFFLEPMGDAADCFNNGHRIKVQFIVTP